MIEKMKIDPNDPNADLEEWARQFDEEFQKYCEEEKKRMEDNGLILCLIFDDENYFLQDEFKASFELKKEDLKDSSQDMKITISTEHINSLVWRRTVQIFTETINTWEIYKGS